MTYLIFLNGMLFPIARQRGFFELWNDGDWAQNLLKVCSAYVNIMTAGIGTDWISRAREIVVGGARIDPAVES